MAINRKNSQIWLYWKDRDKVINIIFSYHSVLLLSNGISPSEAANKSINRILAVYPKFMGAIVVANVNGR